MCGELDGLGFLLDAPYVATPHHGLDAPHHRLDAPFETRRSSWARRSSLGSFGFHSVVSLGPPPSISVFNQLIAKRKEQVANI